MWKNKKEGVVGKGKGCFDKKKGAEENKKGGEEKENFLFSCLLLANSLNSLHVNSLQSL